ncbi:hypothetical protein SAICODRAFT_72556 [Saitoella complicata NRRL Y-17804]|uniref:uncharacterized protein n=1 Tax=Saitoella complicata (strain BCRC 22490 / CBS 7301 / JCM 7358 / NBRC 10748 / NRRL Y-17804) TaxID=698492 RepID=UPI000866CFDC|nr:uncharacterized protein SAICODRAFT_72556 [Saitoella complicata NRRL Y-17804]ODQ51611.1 hypothetical protein SAICODRAFT_72556 [Saitoella complicata NRRL Y-17804]
MPDRAQTPEEEEVDYAPNDAPESDFAPSDAEEGKVNGRADDEDEDIDDAEEPATSVKGDDDEEEEDEDGEPIKRKRGRKAKTEDGEDEVEATPAPKKRRGRPPKAKGAPSAGVPLPKDIDGNRYEVVNDELDLGLSDPEGEAKVDDLGYLQGGREYRCRTFTLLGRGKRLYMLSTEPARCMGYRDSYLFFLKHKTLYKVIMDDTEKQSMIDRDLIPHSYKGRSIGVVTARSVFKEFGARIVVGGKRIIDDYWVQATREAGVKEGDLADPEDRLPPPGIEYNRNQYVAWHGASSVYHQTVVLQPETFRKKKVVMTNENWMLEHARAARRYNTEIARARLEKMETGHYEPNTNLMFYPASTQPTRAVWTQEEGVVVNGDVRTSPKSSRRQNRTVVVATSIRAPAFTVPTGGPGLKDVDPSVFEDCDPAVKEAILKQQQEEKTWEESWDASRSLKGTLKL